MKFEYLDIPIILTCIIIGVTMSMYGYGLVDKHIEQQVKAEQILENYQDQLDAFYH